MTKVTQQAKRHAFITLIQLVERIGWTDRDKMDFFYEEQVANLEDSYSNNPHTKEAEPSEHNENGELQSRDDKTNEAFQMLEEEVNKQYEKTTSVFKKLVVEKDDGIEINLPISNETTEAAQKYLKKLDENIHNVENLAQSYWSKMKTKTFWSGFGSVNNTIKNNSVDIGQDLKEKEIAVGGNRTEAELRTLTKDESIYLDNEMDLKEESFDVDEKTDEICLILQNDKDISKLMNDIVPHQISYKDFWHIYFLQRNRILDKETKRKEILSKKEKEAVEEEVNWDDEDEEIEGEAGARRENETKVEEPKREIEQVNNNETYGDENDDDDDDWE